MTDTTTACADCGASLVKRWVIHRGACGLARRQAREAEYDRVATAYRARQRPPADEVRDLVRMFHTLLEDANATDAGWDALARRDCAPPPFTKQLGRPTQELYVRTQLGLVLARLRDLARTCPAARVAEDALGPLLEGIRNRRPFRAPVTIEEPIAGVPVLVPPPLIRGALLRLKRYYDDVDPTDRRPLLDGELPSDPSLLLAWKRVRIWVSEFQI